MRKKSFLGIALVVVFAVVVGTNALAQTTAWEVHNLTTWADAHYGITQGGDGETHIITVSGNVTIPPTAMFTNTFGNVRDITVIMQGAGTISISGNGSLLRIGNGQTVIVGDLTLQGRNGNNASVVRVERNGTFHMKGSASVTGNHNSLSGGGIFVASGGTLIMQDNSRVCSNVTNASGGGVVIQGVNVRGGGGSFIMKDNARVENNTANSPGGGVLIGNNTTFTMKGGAISGNTVNRGRIGSGGGGLLIDGNGLFTMYNGAISENTVAGGNAWGGGVFGNFTMHNGTISNNIVSGGGEVRGGGVNGRVTMYGGTISGNTVIASRWGAGGGVFGGLIMHGGTISGNTVRPADGVDADRITATGGGVHVGSFTKTGGTIYGNYAAAGLGNIVNGGRGHAVYRNVFGSPNTWRNATAGPNDNSTRLDFWLNE